MMSVKTWRSPKIEVRESAKGGRGVFAVTAISKDELVAIKAGHIVNKAEVDRLTSEIGDYSLQIEDGFYLTPRSHDEVEHSVVFINHSCDSNVGFRGQVAYVAMRSIEPGEDLCHDYALARDDDYRLEICACGSAKCRGTVTGKDWQRTDVQAQYGEYFSAHILRKIKAV